MHTDKPSFGLLHVCLHFAHLFYRRTFVTKTQFFIRQCSSCEKGEVKADSIRWPHRCIEIGDMHNIHARHRGAGHSKDRTPVNKATHQISYVLFSYTRSLLFIWLSDPDQLRYQVPGSWSTIHCGYLKSKPLRSNNARKAPWSQSTVAHQKRISPPLCSSWPTPYMTRESKFRSLARAAAEHLTTAAVWPALQQGVLRNSQYGQAAFETWPSQLSKREPRLARER